jgi:hypothetical protein
MSDSLEIVGREESIAGTKGHDCQQEQESYSRR